MEKAQVESGLAIPKTDNDVKIELNEEFLMELRSNAYCGTDDEDVVGYIAKVLKILDLIKTPNVDTYRLRMMVFPLSLAGDARQWWINEGDGKITTWEELVDNIFCKLYPLYRDGKDEVVSDADNGGHDHFEFITRVIQNSKTIGEWMKGLKKHYCILG
ncbi:hypothetical protein Tco_0740137 [Tanacetum coccineum]